MFKFSPRISFKNTIFFYFVSFCFLLIGLVFLSGFLDNIGGVIKLILPSIPKLSPQQNIGFYFFSFSVMVILLLLFKNLAPGSFYLLMDNELIISMNWFKTSIPLNQITSVQKISCDEVKTIALNLRQDLLNQRMQFQIPKMIEGMTDSVRFIKFSTVPISFVEQELKLGVIVVKKVETNGDFILLTLEGDKKYLLSPKDINGFLEAFNKFTSK